MAPSLLGNLCVCGLVLAFGARRPALKKPATTREELVLESGPLSFNGQTNLFEMKSPRITPGRSVHHGRRRRRHRHRVRRGERDGASRATCTSRSGTPSWKRIRPSSRFEQTSSCRAASSKARPRRSAMWCRSGKSRVTGTASKMSYDYVARTLRMTATLVAAGPKRDRGSANLIYNFTTRALLIRRSRTARTPLGCGLCRMRIEQDAAPTLPNEQAGSARSGEALSAAPGRQGPEPFDR